MTIYHRLFIFISVFSTAPFMPPTPLAKAHTWHVPVVVVVAVVCVIEFQAQLISPCQLFIAIILGSFYG